jgi:hypothetical protein
MNIVTNKYIDAKPKRSILSCSTPTLLIPYVKKTVPKDQKMAVVIAAISPINM